MKPLKISKKEPFFAAALILLLAIQPNVVFADSCGQSHMDRCEPPADTNCTATPQRTWTCKTGPLPWQTSNQTEVTCSGTHIRRTSINWYYSCTTEMEGQTCRTYQSRCGTYQVSTCVNGTQASCSIAVGIPGYEVGQTITFNLNCNFVPIGSPVEDENGQSVVITAAPDQCPKGGDDDEHTE